MTTHLHILPSHQSICLSLPKSQANALAWDLITCLNHQIKDQAEQVLGVRQEGASALVLHFREQVQKQGEVTLDLLSFQILQKWVQQVQKQNNQRDSDVVPLVLEGIAGFDPSGGEHKVDLVRESLDEAQKPTFDVLKKAFPEKLTPEQEKALVLFLDEEDFSNRSIGGYLSALRGQFTFGDYVMATHDAVRIIIDHAEAREGVEEVRERVTRAGYWDIKAQII